MPELGDVEGFRRVALRFAGAQVEQVDVSDPEVLRNASAAEFARSVRHLTLGVATRHGKWLTMPVGSLSIVVHFGMTGALIDGIGAGDVRFDRLVFTTERGLLRYNDRRRLGWMYVAESEADRSALMSSLGPDALAVSQESLRERLGSFRGSIKAAVVDQTRVAGIGNFGSDEILWRAGLHPARHVYELTDLEWRSLYRSMRKVLSATARAGHTPRGRTWLTGARSGSCPRCATPLEHTRVAGRTSAWCPVCQPP